MMGLDTADLCTKFDHFCFSRSGDLIVVPQKFKWFTLPEHAPFRAGLHPRHSISVSTKCEVYISTYYQDITGDTKYRKWDGLECFTIQTSILTPSAMLDFYGHRKYRRSIERIRVFISFP